MDISFSQFIAGISNTNVAACFDSSSTLPTDINPAEALFEIVKGYRQAQDTFNSAAGTGPYLSTVDAPVNNNAVLFDGNGNPYLNTSFQSRFRRMQATTDVMGGSSTIVI